MNPFSLIKNQDDDDEIPENTNYDQKLNNDDDVTVPNDSSTANPSDRQSVLIYVNGYIIVTEFCERLAYYGFAGSLLLFFQTKMGYSNSEADIQFSIWSGACYITPLIGGCIADTCLGRYKTILVRKSFHFFLF